MIALILVIVLVYVTIKAEDWGHPWLSWVSIGLLCSILSAVSP